MYFVRVRLVSHIVIIAGMVTNRFLSRAMRHIGVSAV